MSTDSSKSDELPEVAVLIVNFNGYAMLKDCLESLEKQTYPREKTRVLVVDNDSQDGSPRRLAEEFPWVHVVEAGKNLGFAGGNNLGIEKTHEPFVALLNNDTVVDPDWLRTLVLALQQAPGAGAATSKIMFKNIPGVINNVGLNLYADGSGGDRGFQEPDRGQYEESVEVFGACGASVLLRRAMLEEIGLFDERFFMYYEDLDLSWRARQRGWAITYVPTSLVHHIHCGTSVQWSPFFVFHAERNRVLANLKSAPPPQAARVVASFLLRAARKLALIGLGRERTPHDRALAFAYAQAVLSLAWELPGMLAKRRYLRRHRLPGADRAIGRFILDFPT